MYANNFFSYTRIYYGLSTVIFFHFPIAYKPNAYSLIATEEMSEIDGGAIDIFKALGVMNESRKRKTSKSKFERRVEGAESL